MSRYATMFAHCREEERIAFGGFLMLGYPSPAATAPLLSIPIAYWLEGDRPTRRAVVGGVIAVGAGIALTASR